MVKMETGQSQTLRSVPENPNDKIGEIVRSVQTLREPGEVAEIRAFAGRGATRGYFNDYQELAEHAAQLDNRDYQVYITLNPVEPALLARSENRLESHPKTATADRDIVKRSWLPIDLDSVRPSGISASNLEKQRALQRAADLKDYLLERGWPCPLEADSGNGAHLLYKIDLPNDQQSRELVKGTLEALDFMFSDNTVSVDTSVFNAARIWKLYGTTARKGDSTTDRPHRRSRLLSVPDTAQEAVLSERASWK